MEGPCVGEGRSGLNDKGDTGLTGSEPYRNVPPTYQPYSKGSIVFKFGFGVLIGIGISPIARPYLAKKFGRKLDDLELRLRVKAAQARDRAHGH